MSNYYDNPALSNSDLGLIDKSIFHYLNKKSLKTTDAMEIGKAFHLLVLEPHKFDNEVAIMPELNLRTNDGKAQKESFLQENEGKIIIAKDDYDLFKYMVNNLQQFPYYDAFFNSNDKEIEKEIYFEYRDLPCRAKLDLIEHNNGMIIDLKTINSCERAENVVKYDYSRQAAWYKLALESIGLDYNFMFVFIEKSFPQFPKFIVTSDETLERGRNEYNRILDKYFKYLDNPDCYKGYSENIIIA